jgi:serine/threonine protein kinase
VQPLTPTDPRIAGEYTLKARLGAGGMGRVYLGYSPAGRAVAVKVVHPELARDEEFLARFRNEVAAARMVSGLYTAPVVASGLNDDPPWLATVYVPGPPLDDVVSKHGPLPEGAAWRLAAGLTEAIQAVHASGLVHRDLKPSNVLLASDGPHVIDFGISRALGGSHLTATGIVVGTPGYMSPEQAEGNEAGPPSDVFSLACVVAYAVTGKQPFGSGSAASVLFRVVAGQPDLDGVPHQLRQALEPCLRKNPAERPQLSSLMVTFSSGAGAVADGQSLTSFWPAAVEAVIRAAAQGTPGAASPASPPPGTLQRQPSGFQGPPPGSPYSPPPGFQSPPPGSPYSPPPGSVPGAAQAPGPYAGHPAAYTGQPGAYVSQQSWEPVYPSGSGYQPPSYGQTPPPGPQTPPPYGQTPPPGPQPQAWQAPGSAPLMQAPGMQPQAPGMQPQAPGMQPQGPAFGAAPQWGGQPGAVQPGMAQPGMIQPGYRAARRRPMRSEVPPPVLTSLRFMWAGLGLTVANFIVGIVDIGRLENVATNNPVTPEQVTAQNGVAFLALFSFCAAIIGFVMWPVCATAIRRGRQWGAVTGTVFMGLDLIGTLFVVIGVRGAPLSVLFSLLVWVAGLVAIILAWNPQARAFYQAFR